MKLKKHERMALALLLHAGSDCVGVIDDENKLAAALCFENLKKRGLCHAIIGNNGPTYYLTNAGRRALEEQQ